MSGARRPQRRLSCTSLHGHWRMRSKTPRPPAGELPEAASLSPSPLARRKRRGSSMGWL